MRAHSCVAILALGLSLAGCGEEDTPQSFVQNGRYGATYQRPAVTTDDRAVVHWAADIATGVAPPRMADVPATLTPVTIGGACRLPKPSEGVEIVLVELFSGYDPSPLHLFTESDVDAARPPAQAPVDATAKASAAAPSERPDLGWVIQTSAAGQIDVFVTQTDRPVYLVLSAHAEVLWSLQVAEGARLDAVAVIGSKPQALAHLPEGTRVGFTVYEESPQTDCMVKPQRPVNDTWVPEGKIKGYGETIRQAKKDHWAFRDWLRNRLSEPDRTIDALRTAHVLIGPKPDQPMPYRPLTGARLTYTPNATPLWGSAKQVTDLIRQVAADGG